MAERFGAVLEEARWPLLLRILLFVHEFQVGRNNTNVEDISEAFVSYKEVYARLHSIEKPFGRFWTR